MKAAIVLCVLALGLLLSGCGSDSSDSGGSPSSDSITCVPSEPYHGGGGDCAGVDDGELADAIYDKWTSKKQDEWDAQQMRDEYCASGYDPEVCGP